MVIIFDLDDTLYSELTYIKSSFRKVAKYLSAKYCLSENIIFDDLLSIFYERGRGQVFDEVLRQFDVYKKEEVKRCVAVYRNNIPDIKLFNEAEDVLERLSDYPKYLVTDGNVLVQTRKINALAINKYFKKIILTHRFGKKHAKPATYCFNLIKKIEQCGWNKLVYVADDPNKDFVKLNPLGVGTVRVHTGRFKDMEAPDGYDANIHINDLSELTSALRVGKL